LSSYTFLNILTQVYTLNNFYTLYTPPILNSTLIKAQAWISNNGNVALNMSTNM